MNSLRALLIFILLVVAVISWSDLLNWHTSAPETIAMAEQRADYYLEQFSINTYDPSGTRVQRLSGKHLTHFAHNNTAEINALYLTTHGDEPHWIIRAESGTIFEDDEQIVLNDAVTLQRKPSPLKESILIKGRDMLLDNRSQNISSEDHTTITADSWQAAGTGLLANTQSGDFSFQANTVMTYETTP